MLIVNGKNRSGGLISFEIPLFFAHFFVPLQPKVWTYRVFTRVDYVQFRVLKDRLERSEGRRDSLGLRP